ncbi:MAG TPA: hypothetical protein VGB67_01390, partial [Fibrella sp.]
TLTTTTNAATPTYAYTRNNASIAGANAATYNATLAGTYVVTVTDGPTACQARDTATVTVLSAPAVTVSPATATLACGAAPIQLTASSNYFTGATTIGSEDFNSGLGTFTQSITSSTHTSGAWLSYPSGYLYAGFTQFTTSDASSFVMVNSDSLGSINSQRVAIVSPAYSTVGQSTPAVILNHHYTSYSADSAVAVQASLNGTTWTTVGSFLGTPQGSTTAFDRDTVLLGSTYANQSQVYVRMLYASTWGYYWAINNFQLVGLTPGAVTWSPNAGLFTDAAGTLAYTGGTTPTVYAKPSSNITYAASVSNGLCSGTGTRAVTVTGTPTMLANNSGAADTTLSTQNATTVTLRNADCEMLATVAQSGASQVTGFMSTRVFIDATVQTANNQPYVQRHYDINPATNSSTATATVTLYATQAEFDNYNAVAVPLGYPALPSGGVDNGNVRVTKFSGTSASGAPLTYTPGTATLITPTSVVWNSTNNWWAITIPVTGFSGFFIHSGALFPLQVTGINLAAANEGSRNRVTWQAAGEETEGLRYELERSADGRSFAKIETR